MKTNQTSIGTPSRSCFPAEVRGSRPFCVLTLAFISLSTTFPLSADVIATSSTDFVGGQGQNGWTYGYRDVPAGRASENYDPDRDFIPFVGGEGKGEWNGASQQWTGTAWKAADGSEITGTSTLVATSTRWTIRRWEATGLTEKSPVSLEWSLSKSDTTCGNGVTGALFINGQLADKTTIAFDRATTVTRVYYALLCPADRVDFVLRPHGNNGTEDAQCDNALMALVVNTTITTGNPNQPNGKNFLGSLLTPKFEILSESRSPTGNQVTVNWRSQPAATYGVETSSNLVNWTPIKNGIAGNPCQSSHAETVVNASQEPRFYRVVQESKTLAGLWVGNYDGCCNGLVSITVDENEATAIWTIPPYSGFNLNGQIDWQADITTGVGTGLTSGGVVPGQLKKLSADRITFSKAGLSANTYRRVD